MSEPSLEAKQAAEKWVSEMEKAGYLDFDSGEQEDRQSIVENLTARFDRFDTATAKLREEHHAPLVEYMQKWFSTWKMSLNRHEHKRCGCWKLYQGSKSKFAALTGTGENLSPEGPVTTNKRRQVTNAR